MKTRTLLLFVILISNNLIFIQCNSTKISFQTKIPFKITESYYQDWVGGIPGVFGTRIQLIIDDLKPDIIPDSLFFRDKRLEIEMRTDQKQTVWVAHYNNKPKKDFNMTDRPVGEYGNTPPKMTNFPFDLEKNNAVLSYYYKGILNYYKIENLHKKESLAYPAAKPKTN